MDINKDWVIQTQLNIDDYRDLIIEATKEIESSVVGKSTSGDLSKQYDIYHRYNEEPFINLKNYIASHVKKALLYCKYITPENNVELKASWVVIGKDYGYHQLHKHNDRMPHISTVIYLEVPEDKNKRNIEDKDGYLYFITLENNEIKYNYVEPEVNKMLIFPVWVWHGTYPQKKGRRISLNLDFSIE